MTAIHTRARETKLSPLEPQIIRDSTLGPGKPKPKPDDRRTAVAIGLSRAGVRFRSEDDCQRAVTIILGEIDRVAAGVKFDDVVLPESREPAAPVEPKVIEKIVYKMPPDHVCQPAPEPEPDITFERDTAIVRRKNPRRGVRVCSLCNEEKSTLKASTGLRGGHFVLQKEDGRNRLSSRCRDCLKSAARNRYLSVKKLEALNQARLEFIADEDVVGLRCLGCGEEFIEGQKVVAHTGLRCMTCTVSQDVPLNTRSADPRLAELAARAAEQRGSLVVD